MPYIAILQTSKVSDEMLEAYRYGPVGVTSIGDDLKTWVGDTRLRVWVASNETVAQNQADRLASGLIGARMCANEMELGKWLEEFAEAE